MWQLVRLVLSDPRVQRAALSIAVLVAQAVLRRVEGGAPPSGRP
jgi:hypothetical protein